MFNTTKQEVTCLNCGIIFNKSLNQILKRKNHFCSHSCSAIYNNKHKQKGSRRSKLEIWLEKRLKKTYPSIKFLFNDKTIINSELDIYIPELNLAFELNGIFHYEPIFGIDKLNSIQNNDNSKIKQCLEKHIDLYVIDTTEQKNFNFKSSNKYLNIIKKLIKDKLWEK